MNVLKNSLKILHITRRDFFKLDSFFSHQWVSKRCRRLDLKRVLALLQSCLLKDNVKRRFSSIYLTTFFEVRNFGNTLAMSVIFFSKELKMQCKFQKLRKKLRKLFDFWDNCIWISCIKLSLLRREYLSLAVNILTKSLKIFHITSRDFFKLNCLRSDR